MEERYNLSEGERQTDEFMKPIVVDDTGTIRGVGSCAHTVQGMMVMHTQYVQGMMVIPMN